MKDNSFYMKVLEQEDPTQVGNEFKLHVFKAMPELEFSERLEVDIMMVLTELGIENPKFHMMFARTPEETEKLRVTFIVRDQETSIKIFKHFLENPTLFDGKARVAIFL